MKVMIKRNSANLITTVRLIFAIILVFEFNNIFCENPENTYIILAIIIFITICLSDLLDGIIARRLDICSSFGARLDVYTDLFYIISSAVLLCSKGLIPIWMLVFIIEKIINYNITSALIHKKKQSKFAYVKDPIGRIVSASYFAIPIVAFILHTFFYAYYNLIYCLLIPQAVFGIISSVYRYLKLRIDAKHI